MPGARALRIDQELACDQAVVTRKPAQRRLYAEVLLKTQLAEMGPATGLLLALAGRAAAEDQACPAGRYAQDGPCARPGRGSCRAASRGRGRRLLGRPAGGRHLRRRP